MTGRQISPDDVDAPRSILLIFNPMKSLEEFLISDHVSPELVARFTKETKQQSVKKGTILQSSGEERHRSYFVRKGLLRSYTIDQKGREHVFMFAPEGWVVGDVESQTFETPTSLYIDALEDSEVDIIDSKTFAAFDNLPKEALEQQIKKLIRRISVLQHRVLMLISASAADRYKEFIKTYPNITQRVPQRMIASYLGITPEALSKIRGDISRQ